MKVEIPAIVSKRNHFTPADEFVENAVVSLPDQYKHEEFKGWLRHYTEIVITHIAIDFSTAAQRGIQQAAHLLCDPEFYQTKRRHRENWRKKMEEQQAQQDWEKIERSTCPTAEQIAEQINWAERGISDARAALARHEKRLEELRAMTPKNIRLVPLKTQ